MNEKIAIVGIGDLPVGRHPDYTEKELAIKVIVQALRDAGISKKAVDGLYGVAKGARSETLFAAALAEELRLEPRSMEETTCGATAGALIIKHAIHEIQAGEVEVALCFASEKELHLSTGEWTKVMEKTFAEDLPFGPTIPAYYAMIAQRYMYEYGATPEHLARVAVKNRGNAAKNPRAMYRTPITIKEVLDSRMVATPLHLLDCAPRADGATALILTSGKRARKLKSTPIFIAGLGEQHHCSNFMLEKGPLTSFPWAARAAERAYKTAGLEPKDIHLAELYEPFSVCEIILSEEMGFFPKGEGFRALETGETTLHGQIPINTSGGRLSLGHPAYCTILLMLTHLVRELRGEGGPLQVEGARIGLAQCEHGMNNGAMVIILSK